MALNKACGVVSYKLIPLEQFDYARDYLYKWRGRITGSRMAKRAHPEQRRDQDVRYINAKAKQHGFREKVDDYCQNRFDRSLSLLTPDEIKSVRGWVTRQAEKYPLA